MSDYRRKLTCNGTGLIICRCGGDTCICGVDVMQCTGCEECECDDWDDDDDGFYEEDD